MGWRRDDSHEADTLADVLAANPRPETVRLFEVKGCFVSYDANGAAGTMATDTFIPTVPTNLTANAYTAVVENVPEATVDDPVKAVYAEGLLDLATNEQANVTLVVTPSNGTAVATMVVKALAVANTNGVADVIGYDASYVDLSLYFNDVPQSEIGETIAIHVPWVISPRQVYRVSRVHEGVAELLPVGAENAVDGEYFEVLADGFIIHAKKYSLYAIGEITLQPRFGIVVGNGEKTMGEPDPSYIATNFTITGPEMKDGTGTVKYPATAKVGGVDTGFLKEKANASWTAKADMGCVFAGWVAAENAPEAVTNYLAAFSANELKKSPLSFKVGAGGKFDDVSTVTEPAGDSPF